MKNKKTKLMLIIALAIIAVFLTIFFFSYYKLPEVKHLKYRNTNQISYILDNNEQVIATIGKKNNDYIIYELLPKHLINAIIATEDRKFFKHNGIDLIAIIRASIKNVINLGYVEGASTITQQLAKLYFLSSEKKLRRKLKEALLAIKIENSFSKKEILELYLNKAYFGSGYYGIADASQGYFNKKVQKLNLNESALLAGLLKAPSKYSPYINAKKSKERTNIVLNNMQKYKFLTAEEFVIAYYQDNVWEQNIVNTNNKKYFTDYIIENYKKNYDFFHSDVKIETSFDKNIHNVIEKEIFEIYKKDPLLKNIQIAVVAMSKQGEVFSIIGGRNYQKSQFNRAINAKRQPGSAFKLFVYIEALRNKYSPKDKVIDQDIEIDDWNPQNYSKDFRGKITLREAFVRSINSVSAKLGNELGIENIIKLARKMGIKSKIPNLPSITLGTAEVTLLELTTAYAVIANNGYQVKPFSITNIYDDYDNVLYQHKIIKKRILKQKNIAKMSDLLHGVVVWGTGKNANIKNLYLRGKTGTSQGYKDAWFVGFSEDLVLGIWMGVDKKTTKNDLKITGGSYPAKLFKSVMKELYL